MHPRSTHRVVVLGVALALLAYPLVASAAIGDNTTDAIVGQPNASSSMPNASGINASGLNIPYGAAFDAAGNLFVADTYNHRVLGYRSPMTSDRVADLVIGQPDFNSNTANNGGISASSFDGPIGVAVSAAGDLYVADYRNSRVLEFDRPFATSDRIADRVYGQPDFNSGAANTGGLGAASLSYPTGVAVDSAGNLWVADFANNRVLKFDNPIASDATADFVLGQPSFLTNTANADGASARSLYEPFSVAVDSAGNVWVADTGNNRVLEYDDPTTFGATADRVLGQPSFDGYGDGAGADGLNSPKGLSVDLDGNVYVGDAYNNRILMYTSPIATSDRIADRVHGQPDFNSVTPNTGGISAQTLAEPWGVAIDPAGNVAIVDQENHRVVLLETPVPIVTSLELKVSPTTGRVKFIVRGFGMVSGSAVVEVNGVALEATKYKELAADGSARRVVASDPSFDAHVPPGVPVSVTIYNPLTGSRSTPHMFTR
jgi:sugar lactone lactonase YvrE